MITPSVSRFTGTDLTLTDEQPAQIKCENLYHFGEILEYLEGNYLK